MSAEKNPDDIIPTPPATNGRAHIPLPKTQREIVGRILGYFRSKPDPGAVARRNELSIAELELWEAERAPMDVDRILRAPGLIKDPEGHRAMMKAAAEAVAEKLSGERSLQPIMDRFHETGTLRFCLPLDAAAAQAYIKSAGDTPEPGTRWASDVRSERSASPNGHTNGRSH